MAKTKSSLAPLAKSRMKARAATKGLSVAELEKLVASLSAILKSEKDKEDAKLSAARKAKIAKIRALMAESGLSAADIQNARRGRPKKKATTGASAAKSAAKKAAKGVKGSKVKAKTKAKAKTAAKAKVKTKVKAKTRTKASRKVPPKYRLKVGGQEYLWTGRGRAPRVFKDYMDAGNSKESCLIK